MAPSTRSHALPAQKGHRKSGGSLSMNLGVAIIQSHPSVKNGRGDVGHRGHSTTCTCRLETACPPQASGHPDPSDARGRHPGVSPGLARRIPAFTARPTGDGARPGGWNRIAWKTQYVCGDRNRTGARPVAAPQGKAPRRCMDIAAGEGQPVAGRRAGAGIGLPGTSLRRSCRRTTRRPGAVTHGSALALIPCGGLGTGTPGARVPVLMAGRPVDTGTTRDHLVPCRRPWACSRPIA